MLATDQLTSARREAVLDLLEAVRRYDGVAAVDEAGRLALATSAAQNYLILEPDAESPDADSAAVIGYAGLLADGTAQGAVHPDHRGHGHGRALLRAVLDERPDAGVWAHGALPSSLVFLADAGLEPVRTLLVLERGFGVAALLPERRPSRGPQPQIGAFDPDQDLEQLVEVNAAAFANHPEQGSMTRADVEQRMREPWFDRNDLLVAHLDGRLAAFLWLKREAGAVPEVYVLATAPWAQGRGLGGRLMACALERLEAAGATRVKLYVEGDNEPALALYRRWGFAEEERHVQLRRPAAGERA